MASHMGRLAAVFIHSCKSRPQIISIKPNILSRGRELPHFSRRLLCHNPRHRSVLNCFSRGFKTKSSKAENVRPPPSQEPSNLLVLMKYGCATMGFVILTYQILGMEKALKLVEDEEKSGGWSISRSNESSRFKIYIDDQAINTNYLQIVALNAIGLLMWRVNRFQIPMTKWFTLSAVPGVRNIPSMFLSAFSHKLFFHFLVNMYVLRGFVRPWEDQDSNNKQGYSKFDLFLPFYCSAAVVSGLLSFTVKLITSTQIPSLGASGAIMALLGYACSKYPDSLLSVVFVPGWSFSAKSGLNGVMIFDGIGLLTMLLRNHINFQSPFDHAGHLGGLLFGIWYANGGEKVLVNVADFFYKRFKEFLKSSKDSK